MNLGSFNYSHLSLLHRLSLLKMDPRLFPISCLFILITILNHVPASVAVDDTQFTNCSQLLQCGNTLGIGYPFWGGNRPEYCGHPSFSLNCQGEAPLITIEERQYRILSITNESYALTVAREDFWNDDCPQYLHNATLDTTHFNYGPNFEDLILYYGCRTPTSGVQLPNQFACTQNSSTDTFGIYGTTSLSNTINASVACGSSVIVKVNQTAAQALAQTSTANVTEVLNSGFGLQWNANNTVCETCAGSGGKCGSNTSTGSFVCYCPDQPYPLTCGDASTSGSGKCFL